MAEVKDPWFVIERSQSLAALLLTNQKSVDIVFQRKKDDGVNFVVAIVGENTLPTQMFIVQVKGTLSASESDWLQGVNQLFLTGGGQLYLPTCVFVVNVRTNAAVYAWIAEPTAEANGATLRLHQSPTFHVLNDEAVTEIVCQVKAYYDVMPMQLQTTC